MALNISLNRIFPGFGVAVRNNSLYQNLGVVLGASTTVTLPSTSTFPIGLVAGKIRLKVYAGSGTTPVLTDIKLNALDGTNTVCFYNFHPGTGVTLSSTSWFEHIEDFLIDTAASGSGGGATGQLSSTNGGATSFNAVITLTGTGEAALADFELAGAVL